MSTQFSRDVGAIEAVLESYRHKVAEHERLVTKLHGLLMEDRSDEALDLVRDAFCAIHGPKT